MKLSPTTIYVLGFSASAVALAAGYFMQFSPNMTEAKMYADSVESLRPVAQSINRAEDRVEAAIELVKQEDATWRQIVARRTPPQSVAAGGIDVSKHGWQLAVDTRAFRNNVQKAVNAQVKRGGVTVISGPTVPGITEDTPANTILSSYFNFPPLPFPVVIYDLGAVTVQGTYNQIMDNVRAYANMPNYLAVADGLRLQGTSPLLTGTYNLTIVGFIRGKEVFPNLPEGGGAAAGGMMGGMGGSPIRGMGGPPSGMMGGPPTGFGGPPPGMMGGPGMGRQGGPAGAMTPRG